MNRGVRFADLSEETFERIGRFIQSEYGIKMPKKKKVMVQTRLQKRLRILNIETFDDYADYVFSADGQSELICMIDAVTTNKTDFFREPEHFQYLADLVVPRFIEQGRKEIIVWSAGCSTGAEPYTLAMVLNEIKDKTPGFDFHVLATDISTQVLDTARKAVYPHAKILPVPMELRKKYFLKNKDPNQNVVRVVPWIRKKVQTARLNLMDERFQIDRKVDVIFCRNVLIYFDQENQKRLLTRFFQQLRRDSFLFLGHSETINGLGLPYVPFRPTVYRKQG